MATDDAGATTLHISAVTFIITVLYSSTYNTLQT